MSYDLENEESPMPEDADMAALRLELALLKARIKAQAIEAQRAETPKSGSVEDESAVAKPCAQTPQEPGND